jgi:hypothetical protein
MVAVKQGKGCLPSEVASTHPVSWIQARKPKDGAFSRKPCGHAVSWIQANDDKVTPLTHVADTHEP